MERFSSDDARRIFADAAQTRTDDVPAEPHLTLGELQEIGRSAGLDPAAIAAAASRLRTPATEVPVWHGVPQRTRSTRSVAGAFSDDAWAATVAECRRTFGAQGTVEQIGARRTWTHVVGEASQTVLATLSAETRDGVTHLTAESMDRGEAVAGRLFPSVLGALGVLVGAAGWARGDAGGLPWAVLLLAMAAATYALMRWSSGRAARRDRARYDALIDRVSQHVEDADAAAGQVVALSADPVADPDPAEDGRRIRADLLEGDGLGGDVLEGGGVSTLRTPAPRRTRA